MKHTKVTKILLVLFAVVLCFGPVGLAEPVGTAFTYQGRLIDSNNAADGLYDFQFKLFDANNAGNKLGADVNKPEVDVIDGYFTVELDYGNVYDGNNRWLEIGVRPGIQSDPCAYSLLSPRQKVTPTPYALYAKTAGSGGGVSPWQVNGTDIYYNDGNVGIGTAIPSEKLTVEGGTIKASTPLSSGKGVYGEASNSGNYTNYGGYFQAAGNYGRGVYGASTNTGDYTNYGGYFSSAGGSGGRAVYGEASNSGNVANCGGYFKAYGTSGTGVLGMATNNTGNFTNYGGYFQAAGSSGRGVYGKATGSNGYGVFGEASNSGDYTNYGGHFSAAGSSGIGVSGEVSGSYGMGVYGVASNNGDYYNCGGWFSAAGSTGAGVEGVASNSGNYTNYGGYFYAAGSSGRGVYGKATGSSGIGVYGYGGQYDFYAGGPGTNYGPFTGGHEVKLSDDFPANTKVGMIVSVTGKTEVRRDDEGEISISSTLPTVKLCNVPNDKAVFGVFVAECPLPEDHWYKAKEGKRFATVNALGEGRAWVCNINGEVQVGDYITTSAVAGYGQKQSDDLLRSCTLGKATESVDWDSVTETVEFGGRTYKVYLIAVVYTSG